MSNVQFSVVSGGIGCVVGIAVVRVFYRGSSAIPCRSQKRAPSRPSLGQRRTSHLPQRRTERGVAPTERGSEPAAMLHATSTSVARITTDGPAGCARRNWDVPH